MFIRLIKKTHVDELGRTWTRNHGIFKCDHCESEYESGNNLKRDLDRKRNYCSHQCASDAKKYGGKSHDAFVTTNRKHHGVNYPAQCETIRARMTKTNRKRYGSSSSLGCANIQQKANETRIKRYGAKYSAQIPGVMKKIAETNIRRYGVTCPMNAPEIVAKYDHHEMTRKRINTMRKNRTFCTSQPEHRMYRLLRDNFDVVHTQVTCVHPTKRWVIDFYVPVVNTYIQVDGVYWHGLNRPIEMIKESTRPRDQAIYKKWLSDREQNEWFKEHNMRLLRFTDKEVNEMTSLPSVLTLIQ
jgi:hypothetical protein